MTIHDSTTIVLGVLIALMGLGVILFYLHHQRMGKPIYWQRGKHQHPKLAMSALHAALMSFFFFGVSVSLIGMGSGWDLGRWGIPLAALSVFILIPMTIIQQSCLNQRHKKVLIAQGLLQPEKKVPLWVWLPILALVGYAILWLYQKNEARQAAMLDVVNGFAESAHAADYQSAWQYYSKVESSQPSLDNFQRAMAETGFAGISDLRQVEFSEPYKMSDGIVRYLGKDAQGREQRYSLVFTPWGSGLDKLLEPRYVVRRFTHDTPMIAAGVKRFLQYLRSGDDQKARQMAYLHQRDAEGNLLYTLDARQLREHTEALGLLSARRIEFAHPTFEEDGRKISQDIWITPIQGARYRVRMAISLDPRSSGTRDGVAILGIDRVRE